MELLAYSQKPKVYDNFDTEIRNYLNDKTDTPKIEAFKLRDYGAVMKGLEALSKSEEPQNMAASELAATLLDSKPADNLQNVFKTGMPESVSDFEKIKFLALVNIASNPYIVIQNLYKGILSFRDVDNLEQTYPDIHQSLSMSLVDVLSTYLSTNDYFDLTTEKIIMLAKLLGITFITPSRLKKVQESYSQKPQQGTDIQAPEIATDLNELIQNS